MEKQIESRKCYLYVLNSLSDWEIAYLTAELKSGRYLSKNVECELITVASQLKPIATMGGMIINPQKSIEMIDFKEGDLLVLPGADTWMEEDNKTVLSKLDDLLKKRVIVAAICGATIALAQTGLLNNKKHTSNGPGFLNMFCPDYKGDSYYVDEPVAVDENLITASGLAPLEFTQEILKTIKVMKAETLEAWYQLFRTREPQYFYGLMESLK